jgi:protein subunit release factor A
LIENIDLAIPGNKFNTTIWETDKLIKKLTDFLKGQLKNNSDTKLIEKINSSIKTAFYDFYDLETEENSRESITDTLQRLGEANQTLWFLRELVRPDASTNETAQETVATLDKLIEALNNKIDKLLRER